MSVDKFEMIRNADVQLDAEHLGKNKYSAIITVNDKYQHEFDVNSRISKALSFVSINEMNKRLNGGHFFFVDDQLVDFRDGKYKGFVHSDQTINKFVNNIGITTKDDDNLIISNKILKGNSQAQDILLGSQWSNYSVELESLGLCNHFTSGLWFKWNPFAYAVGTSFLITRMICGNVLDVSFNRKVPVENRWEEHLNIANKQMQNKMNNYMSKRFAQMVNERSTVNETILLTNHLVERLNRNVFHKDSDQYDRLKNIKNIIDPMKHLNGVYKDSVFDDMNIASRMPSHLTSFDLFNLATEIRTHTEATQKSTDNALNDVATNVLFRKEDITQYEHTIQPRLSSFSDPEMAFYGEVC